MKTKWRKWGIVFAGPVNSIESEMVPLMEATPEEKLAFAPKDGAVEGVRAFSRQATQGGGGVVCRWVGAVG